MKDYSNRYLRIFPSLRWFQSVAIQLLHASIFVSATTQQRQQPSSPSQHERTRNHHQTHIITNKLQQPKNPQSTPRRQKPKTYPPYRPPAFSLLYSYIPSDARRRWTHVQFEQHRLQAQPKFDSRSINRGCRLKTGCSSTLESLCEVCLLS